MEGSVCLIMSLEGKVKDLTMQLANIAEKIAANTTFNSQHFRYKKSLLHSKAIIKSI